MRAQNYKSRPKLTLKEGRNEEEEEDGGVWELVGGAIGMVGFLGKANVNLISPHLTH